jgi:APA family basic amino acid/polyamine antiporter
MGRDGLLPAWASRVHPRHRTPHVATWLTGIIVALCSSVANINELVELTNIGTLFAFSIVALGILILRAKEPNRHRPFRTPWVPFVPLAAIGCCVYLMAQLPVVTWLRFFGWMFLGLLVYAFYGFQKSRLRAE